jgi:hypothetical protein
MGLDTKTYPLTDRQSQCDFDVEMCVILTRDLLLLTESDKQQTHPLVRERPTPTSLQLSDSNKDLVLSPRWVLYSKTEADWTVGRNITLILTLTLKCVLQAVVLLLLYY